MKKEKAKKGSIALISVLVITSILLILAVAMAEAHVSVLSQYQDDVMSKSSFYGAESCLEETIRELELDTSYTGTSIIRSAASMCSSAVTDNGNIKGITVTNIEEGLYTQQYQGEISITPNGTANNALLTDWKKI